MAESGFEMLDVEEYAKRLSVSRATIFDWKAKGYLKPGKHFLQIGRVIRYKWSEEAINSLMEESSRYCQSEHHDKELPSISASLPSAQFPQKRVRKAKNFVNIDYGV